MSSTNLFLTKGKPTCHNLYDLGRSRANENEGGEPGCKKNCYKILV